MAQGANEIRAIVPGASLTTYHTVREIDGDIWYPTGQVFEAFGTAARTMADYDVAMVDKSGGFFVGTMDTNISAGQYYVVTHLQMGGSPADTDPAVWQEYGDWSGSTWVPATITPADVADAVWDEALAGHTTETTFGGELGTLDPNITLILADTNDLRTWWANGGRLDLIQDTIAVDVAGLDGDAMRGTDSANTTVPDAAGTAAALHALTDGAIATAQADLDIITGADGVIVSTASTNAVWAMAMIDLPAGAPSATCSVLTAINYVYEAWRNKTETTLTEISLFKNDGATKLVEADIADDGAKFTKGEYGDED